MKAHYYTNLVEGGRTIQGDRLTNQGKRSERGTYTVRRSQPGF